MGWNMDMLEIICSDEEKAKKLKKAFIKKAVEALK